MPDQTQDKSTGNVGIGVVQPQSGLDYPFVSPGLGRQTLVIADVENLFADFYFSYDDVGYYSGQEETINNPLRIHWLYGFGEGPAWSSGSAPIDQIEIPAAVHAADLMIVDSGNNVIFDSTLADVFTERTWGEYYTIYEWQKTTKPNEAICRAVKYNKTHNTVDIPQRPVEYCPQNAVLDERTIEKIPKRVLALRAQNGDCVTPWFKEKVSFVNGHNLELEMSATETVNLRRETDVSFTVVAGTGTGQYGLCATGICEEDAPTNVCPPGEDQTIKICTEVTGEEIKNINGIKPDNAGNIFLTANDCLWVRKPATYTDDTPHNYAEINNTKLRAVMAVGSDCGPCCACEDYLETARYTTKLGQYYINIGDRVKEIKTIHEENIGRWEQQLLCRARKPLELLLTPQPCPCMDVVLFYCNHCNFCVENVVLTVNFSTDPAVGGAVIDSKHSSLVADNKSSNLKIKGGWPVFSVQFPTVAAGASVYAQFRVCVCPPDAYTLRGVLTGSSKNGPILAGCAKTDPPAVAEASQIFDCGEVPGICCT